jgi:hypothetical protein
LYRGIRKVRREKGDLVVGSHNILNTLGNHYFLNAHVVNEVRQTEIQTAVPLRAEPSAFNLEMAIEKLKRHISLNTDQISREM